MNRVQPIDMSPRADDMAKVRRIGARLVWNHDDKDLVRYLPYVAMYAAGVKSLEELPTVIAPIVARLGV